MEELQPLFFSEHFQEEHIGVRVEMGDGVDLTQPLAISKAAF